MPREIYTILDTKTISGKEVPYCDFKSISNVDIQKGLTDYFKAHEYETQDQDTNEERRTSTSDTISHSEASRDSDKDVDEESNENGDKECSSNLVEDETHFNREEDIPYIDDETRSVISTCYARKLRNQSPAKASNKPIP